MEDPLTLTMRRAYRQCSCLNTSSLLKADGNKVTRTFKFPILCYNCNEIFQKNVKYIYEIFLVMKFSVN